MGEFADGRVLGLLKGLCDSFPIFEEENGEGDACFKEETQEMVREMETDASVSHDKVLASLFDMGYEIDDASRAILECGCLDVAAIIEHLSTKPPTSPASELIGMRSTRSCNLPLPSAKIKVEEQDSSFGTGATFPRAAAFEASSSQAEPDDVKHCKPSARSFGTHKGKFPMSSIAEDDDGGHRDHPGNENLSYLLSMGFERKEVTDAIEACGIDSHVNELVNHIVNNAADYRVSNRGDFEDSTRELSDQGCLILKKVQSMGFPCTAQAVGEAIQACGKNAEVDALVNYLLRTDGNMLRGDNSSEALPLTKVEQLQWLGCSSTATCLRAIDNNGDADIDELLDYYFAEELQDQEEDHEDDENEYIRDRKTLSKKRKRKESAVSTKQLQRRQSKGEDDEEDDLEESFPHFHRNLKGFGLPGEPVITRVLSEDISCPPYFYFENVAYTPKDEWKNIQRHLYNIAPEFVDSLNFSPCRRPRGYVHNLPVEGRVNILPKLPMSIQELFPGSVDFWPTWDQRVKLNTINTRSAPPSISRKMNESMQRGDDIKSIMYSIKKWNLVWVKPGVLSPLTPEEIETCLGFDISHTRALFSTADRVRALGNSFQVTTVAYHLSVLRPIYKSGIRVLSLFSGIGGAEVALHKLGIFLKLVVSVEIDKNARMVVDSWWKTTNQKGTRIDEYTDVRQLDSRTIQSLVDKYGGFDLIIGGSPCNNLSGNNRFSRTGLAGPASVTFFEFPRILTNVRDCMAQKRR